MSKEYPKHKWVAYTEKLGRTEVGVYERKVEIIDGSAYVLPKSDGNVADILPKANVFETQEEAIRFLSGDGVPRWIIYSGRSYGSNRDPEECCMFQGNVKYYTQRKYGEFHQAKSAVRISDGKVFSSSNIQAFDTRRECEAIYRKIWSSRMADLTKEKSEIDEKMKFLLSNKPRSGKKKV